MYQYSPFRNEYNEPGKDTCVFCDADTYTPQIIRTKSGIAMENEHYRWIINQYPKFDGHTLLCPKRHITQLHEELPEEVLARNELLVRAAEALRAIGETDGIEIFLQTGATSESSVAHLHWHIVPASKNDPFRSFEKLGHFYTTKPDEEKIVLFPVTVTLAREQLLDALAEVL